MGKIWAYVTIVVTCASLFTWVWQGRYDAGYNAATASMLAAVNESANIAREDEQLKQEKVNEIAQAQYDKVAAINLRLNADLDRLRNRPGRSDLPEGALADCQGTTGRELSREDAEAFTGLAADAEKGRVALEVCYKYADIVADIVK